MAVCDCARELGRMALFQGSGPARAEFGHSTLNLTAIPAQRTHASPSYRSSHPPYTHTHARNHTQACTVLPLRPATQPSTQLHKAMLSRTCSGSASTSMHSPVAARPPPSPTARMDSSTCRGTAQHSTDAQHAKVGQLGAWSSALPLWCHVDGGGKTGDATMACPTLPRAAHLPHPLIILLQQSDAPYVPQTRGEPLTEG